jgi:hypothetical protein
MFIAALLTLAKLWDQLRCPSISIDGLKNAACIPNGV